MQYYTSFTKFSSRLLMYFRLCVGFFQFIYRESFIPMLPLVAIVTANAALFGMVKGFLISWLGSVTGNNMFIFISLQNRRKQQIIRKN